MAVLLFGALALIGFRMWMRLQETSSAIEALTERVIALEQAQPLTGTRLAREPEPKRPSAAIVDAMVPASAVPREPTVRPHVRQAPPPPTPPTPMPTPTPLAAPPVVAAQRAPSSEHEALESRIGSRWLLYVGVVAIVIGVSYFEKLAIENHWVNETWRTIQGGIAGLLLVGGGLRIVKNGYPRYGQILAGAGVAILYVSTYAAFNFYYLIGHPAAFVLMTAITALSAWLADSQRSQGLALVAVSGGFATPFLLPTGVDAEAALFGYDAVLIAGTMLLARRRDWPALNIVSYGFTVLTFLSWAALFYAPSKYLTTELFLTLFCAMFLYGIHASYRFVSASARLQRAVLWTAPFGYHVLSLANLFEHSSALLVYLVVLALVGVLVASRTNSRIRLVFWLAVAAPLLAWSASHGQPSWLTGGLSAWAGVYILNLAGLFESTLGDESDFALADIALLHVNGLGAYLGAYLLIEPIREVICAPLAAVLALLNIGLGYVVRKQRREESLHFVALAFTLFTIAIALRFDAAWITCGWATEGVVLAWLGLRERRQWLRAGGLALFGAAIARLGLAQLSEPTVGEVVLLNSRGLSGLFVSGLTYLLAYLHNRYDYGVERKTEVAAGLVLASLLSLAVAVSEIGAYWQLHVRPPFEPAAQMIIASILAGTGIVWLGLQRKEEWVRAVGAAVLAIAMFALFTIQLAQAPVGYVTALNGRAFAGVFAVVVLYGLVAMHRRSGRHIGQLATNMAILMTTAGLMTLSLLTSEIDAFWAARGAATVWSGTREGLQSAAWAAVGGFLIWYGLSVRRAWSRAIGGGLLLVAVLRLLRLHFASPPVEHVVLANARVMTSIVVIALLYGLAHLYAKDPLESTPENTRDDPEEGRSTPATALRLVANALTLTLLTGEITAHWHVYDTRHTSDLASTTMHFAREMTLSLTWAVYATILAIVGLIRKYAPIRYFAMTVFAITIVKVFAIDLAELDRIYRVLSIIGLGVTLLVTSYLYQKLTTESHGTNTGIE